METLAGRQNMCRTAVGLRVADRAASRPKDTIEETKGKDAPRCIDERVQKCIWVIVRLSYMLAFQNRRHSKGSYF